LWETLHGKKEREQPERQTKKKKLFCQAFSPSDRPPLGKGPASKTNALGRRAPGRARERATDTGPRHVRLCIFFIESGRIYTHLCREDKASAHHLSFWPRSAGVRPPTLRYLLRTRSFLRSSFPPACLRLRPDYKNSASTAEQGGAARGRVSPAAPTLGGVGGKPYLSCASQRAARFTKG
jgi:hypothetical protein